MKPMATAYLGCSRRCAFVRFSDYSDPRIFESSALRLFWSEDIYSGMRPKRKDTKRNRELFVLRETITWTASNNTERKMRLAVHGAAAPQQSGEPIRYVVEGRVGGQSPTIRQDRA